MSSTGSNDPNLYYPSRPYITDIVQNSNNYNYDNTCVITNSINWGWTGPDLICTWTVTFADPPYSIEKVEILNIGSI